jgi:hypothetical protein
MLSDDPIENPSQKEGFSFVSLMKCYNECMGRKKLLLTSLISATIVGLADWLVIASGNAVSIPLMLFIYMLSGFTIATCTLWISVTFGHIEKIADYKVKSFVVAMLSVSIIMVVWLAFGSFHGDIVSDFLASLLGALCAYMYFTKQKKCKAGICEDFYFPKNNLTAAR